MISQASFNPFLNSTSPPSVPTTAFAAADCYLAAQGLNTIIEIIHHCYLTPEVDNPADVAFGSRQGLLATASILTSLIQIQVNTLCFLDKNQMPGPVTEVPGGLHGKLLDSFDQLISPQAMISWLMELGLWLGWLKTWNDSEARTLMINRALEWEVLASRWSNRPISQQEASQVQQDIIQIMSSLSSLGLPLEEASDLFGMLLPVVIRFEEIYRELQKQGSTAI